MKKNPKLLEPPRERIQLDKLPRRQAGGFLAFLICVALLITAFAFSGVWLTKSQKKDPSPSEQTADRLEQTLPPTVQEPSVTEEQSPIFIPTGAIPVVDFHDSSAGSFRNDTEYCPDTEQLKAMEDHLSINSSAPTVLVLHTHASEAYLKSNVPYLEGRVGDLIYSDVQENTVVAVGKAFCEELNARGIVTVHCAENHGEEGTLRNAYTHAAKCIRAYLERYPTIQCVIDLHRDGILTAEGELVRTVSNDESSLAQVMAIVGTDGNGTDCPEWENNLSLALRLFDRMERHHPGTCRAVQLRRSSYNQELAHRMLLLEIGSAGNTVEEACATARVTAATLAELIGNG